MQHLVSVTLERFCFQKGTVLPEAQVLMAPRPLARRQADPCVDIPVSLQQAPPEQLVPRHLPPIGGHAATH